MTGQKPTAIGRPSPAKLDTTKVYNDCFDIRIRNLTEPRRAAVAPVFKRIASLVCHGSGLAKTYSQRPAVREVYRIAETIVL